MNLKIVILAITAILNVVLGILVYWQGRKNTSNILWSLLLISVAGWAGVRVLLEIINNQQQIILSTYFLYSTASLIPFIFLFFALIFPNEKFILPKYNLFFLLPFFLINLLTFVPGILIRNVVTTNEQYKIFIFGPAYFWYSLYIVSYFIFAFIILFKKYSQSAGILKLQLRYILIGTLVSSGLGIINNLILPWLGYFKYFWLGPVFSTFLIIMVTYAITRHHFLNIKVVSAEIFTALLILIFLTETLLSQNLTELLFRSFVLLLLSIFGYILIKGVLQEIKLKEEYQSLNEKLKNLNKLKSEFLSFASHQVKSPMTVVKGYASLIFDGSFGPVSEKIKETAEKIVNSADRMIALVNNLLDLRKIEEGKMEYNFEIVNLNSLIGGVVEELKVLAQQKNLDLAFERLPQEIIVQADPQKLRQVIQNLIDNAIKYTEKGWVKVTIAIDKQSVLITVSDSGQGISKELLPNLFQQFTRESAIAKAIAGTGLGLYLAKKIVEAHRGQIWAESPGLNQGSSFFVKIPLA